MPRVTRNSKKSDSNVEEEKEEPKKTTKSRVKRKISTDESSESNESLSLSSPNSSPKIVRSNSISPITDKVSQLQVTTPKSSRFRSARRALADNSNLRLPGREKQFDELTSFLNNLIDTKSSASLYINGPPGTGKTATLMKIVKSEEYASKLKIAFINSTSISSIGAIYKKICVELKLKISTNAGEKECLTAVEKYLHSNKSKTTLLVLDEIDQLCSSGKNQNVLYHIFEWPSILNSNLILIGIANSLDLTDRLLVRLQSKCELKPKVMHFPAYTKSEIVDIFKSRLEESDLFPPAAIQLLAAKVSAISGDIRRALNIGKRVIELAEMEKKKTDKMIDMKQLDALVESENVPVETENEPKIQLKEVMSVLNNVYGCSQSLSNEVDDAFPLQQKILICTMLLIIKNDKNKDLTIGRLHDVYKRVCKNRNINATDLSEFVNLCLLVETRGILRLIKKKEPRFHKVQLQWNEDEVYSSLKDKQMITNILNEQSLLSR